MPAPRPAPRPLRATALPAAAALAALALAAAGCGPGPTPAATCTVAPVVTADRDFQLFGPAEWDPACATLTVNVPALGADERLGVALVNAGGPDAATPSLALSGPLAASFADPGPVAATQAPPAPLAQADAAADRAALDAGHALAAARRGVATEAWLADGAPPPPKRLAPLPLQAAAAPQVGDPWPTAGGPCVYSFSTGTVDRRAATLQHVSANALYYVTDDVWTGAFTKVLAAEPDLWSRLDSYFEGTALAGYNDGGKRILPALHESFGTETVNPSGKLVFLFADLGGPASSVVVGYFDSTDVLRALDTTAHCTGSGSNGTSMLYLLDPCTFNRKGIKRVPAATTCDGTGVYPYARIIDEEVPGTMAHELQHNVINATRCMAPLGPTGACAGITAPTQDLWLNEGLAMTSEDFAGFGFATSGERARVAVYLNCKKPSGNDLCYQDVSLTAWPSLGNAVGHYGGAHAFVRWLADQAAQGRAARPTASALTRALVASDRGSRSAVADAYGQPFETAFARFATAAMFSGEDPLFAGYTGPLVPSFSFQGGAVPWSPLHTKLTSSITSETTGLTTTYQGYVAYMPLPRPGDPAAPFTTTLAADGWGGFVTNRGTGGAVTLTLTSTAAVKPRAAVVRFKGTLPAP